jgi:hypothetical protein
MLALTARWTMREPEFERVGLSDRISVPGWVDLAHRSRPPNILALTPLGAHFLKSMIENLALTARPPFVPQSRRFRILMSTRGLD